MNTPLSWKKFIERAEVSGRFSRRAIKRVESWPTCAVGEIDGALRYSEDVDVYVPKDFTLEALGIRFMHVVGDHKVATARKVYQKIRSRARELRLL